MSGKKPEPTRYEQLVRSVSRLAEESPFWERVLEELKRSKRRRRVVNVEKLNRVTKPNERVLVLGKLLGTGKLRHPLTVIALDFSESSYRKVAEAGGKPMYLDQFITSGGGKPDVSGIRLIG
jgi:large subunit ribosomal protein L18e